MQHSSFGSDGEDDTRKMLLRPFLGKLSFAPADLLDDRIHTPAGVIISLIVSMMLYSSLLGSH